MCLGTSLVCWYIHLMACVIIHTLFVPGEDNLVDVIGEVMDVAAKWSFVGLALRLKAAELNAISLKNKYDPTECLKDMLLAWVQQHYDINEFGPPSWRLLCQAIFKEAGGNNPALARKIAEHHRGHAH